MTNDKPSPPEHIRALLDAADRACAQAEVETRRIERALQRPAIWPDRRRPRRWTETEYGREAVEGTDSRD